ncbi:MAG: hypothetical protein JXO49_06725 [Deltaproteobacteria bacterium]|nr:hypothetical protein [Candidatus Anaeroferrophillus wilburensis]MBN2889022.1 hypothetical protein [Deltaproteobacteria bacterium]
MTIRLPPDTILAHILTIFGKIKVIHGLLCKTGLCAKKLKAGAVLLVHHNGKSGNQRGTSRKEDVLDTVIQLKNPVDYNPDQGALLEVHFRKSRNLTGECVSPFEARLTINNGLQEWQTKSLEDSNMTKVRKLLAEGYSQTGITDKLGLSKGYVSKLAKKIREDR